MANFLSEEWMVAYQEAFSALPEIAGLDVTTQYVISGGPDGKVTFHEVIVRGQVVAVATGKSKEATVTVTWKYDQAVAEHSGERSVEVAFMAARNKIEGDYLRYLMDFREMRRTSEYQAAKAALAAATTF